MGRTGRRGPVAGGNKLMRLSGRAAGAGIGSGRCKAKAFVIRRGVLPGPVRAGRAA
jgi:hypothetical protein